MARKTREESLNTKNRILDAAELVLLEKGVGQTAMADIAEAAGMSRGAVYGHFNGKIEVCVAVCDRAFSRAVEGFDLSDERPALATLRLAASHYLHQCGEPGSMQRVLEILYMKCEQSEENAPLMRRRALRTADAAHREGAAAPRGRRGRARRVARRAPRGRLSAVAARRHLRLDDLDHPAARRSLA
ncbi:HTH-type transcriptional regulator TtgR [Burkholderia pseudomallei]|nr:HTH-type transcriptional regulator TtgR [Burkholderia pseudomallei]CAJ4556947.1 TetR family regulatory protein [Burkholderia pseudomallei]